MGEKGLTFLARLSFTSILTLFTSKWWNVRKRFDLLAGFSFTSILTLFTSKWWNRRKRLDLLGRFSFASILTLFTNDLLARFSFTSILTLFTSKWWNGRKGRESTPPPYFAKIWWPPKIRLWCSLCCSVREFENSIITMLRCRWANEADFSSSIETNVP